MKERILQRLINSGIVCGPSDPLLRRREFAIEEWHAMPELLKEWFYVVAPKQCDDALAAIAGEKKRDAEVRHEPRKTQPGASTIATCQTRKVTVSKRSSLRSVIAIHNTSAVDAKHQRSVNTQRTTTAR